VRRYLRDPTFSRFDTIPENDKTYTETHRQTDRQTHDESIYRASIASRGKKEEPSANNDYIRALNGIETIHLKAIDRLLGSFVCVFYASHLGILYACVLLTA